MSQNNEYDYFDITHGNPVNVTTTQNPNLHNSDMVTYHELSVNTNSQSFNQDITQLLELLKKLVPLDYEYVYERCTALGLDVRELKLLELHHIEKLIPDDKFAVRVRFEAALKKWNEQKVTDYDVADWLNTNPSSAIADPVTIVPSANINNDTTLNVNRNISVNDILKLSPNGNSVLHHYEITGNLGEKRKTLIHIIVEYFIFNGLPLSSQLCDNLADEIIILFPKEEKETYYKWRSKKCPKGQLWDRFQNQARKSRTAREAKSRPTTQEVPKESISFNKEESEEVREWLKNHNEPWPEVLKKWEQTSGYRRKIIMDNTDPNIIGILNTWPLYKHSLGYTLVDVDYNFIKNNGEDLLGNWEAFLKKIMAIIQTRINDSYEKKMLSTLNNTDNDEYRNYIIFMSLHCLLPPTISRRKGVLDRKKHSIKDSQDSFISMVNDSSEIPDKIKFLNDECLKNKSTFQPLVIVVGNMNTYSISEFYVYYDKTTYKLCTLLKSIDICFKIYQVFNLQYPTTSEIFWEFVQRYFYKLTTNSDKNTSKISGLISDLK